MVQDVSPRSFTAEVCVYFQTHLCGILWWVNWHCDKFFFSHLGFPLSPVPPALSQTHSTMHFSFFPSTTYTTAAYGSNPNVFIRLDSVGRPGSVGSGSYATIASFHKLPLPVSRRSSSSPSPYATANIGSAIGSATYVTSTNGSGRYSHHIYSKPASTYLPSRVSYYASSQLTHLSQVGLEKDRRNNMDVNICP